MGRLDPLELDVISDEPATENESIVLNGAKQRRPLLVLCVVAFLGLIGWQLFSTGQEQLGEGEGGPVASPEIIEPNPDDEAPLAADENVESPGIEPSTTEQEPRAVLPDSDGERAIGGTALQGNDAPEGSTEPAFPVFPDRPGLTLALIKPTGEVLLINTDDGAMTVLPSSASSASQRSHVRQVGQIGGTVVTQEGQRVVGFPLDGSPRIDFGRADVFALTDELVVLQRWSDGPGGALQFQVRQFRGFQPDGLAGGEWVDAPNGNMWMNQDGFVSAPGGTYRFAGSGFERASSHNIVATGPNHVLEHRCDAVLDCNYYRVEARTGRAEAVVLNTSSWWQPEVSPDGRWIGFTWWGGDNPKMVVVDLKTGQESLLSSSATFDGSLEPSAPSWDSTSRYAVAGSLDGRGLTVFDAETKQIREISRDALGLDFRVHHVIVVEPGHL